jgi:hypothetical protein
VNLQVPARYYVLVGASSMDLSILLGAHTIELGLLNVTSHQ